MKYCRRRGGRGRAGRRRRIVAVVGVDEVVLVLVDEVAALEAVTVTVLAAPEPQPASPTAASTHAGASRRFIAGSLSSTVRAGARC